MATEGAKSFARRDRLLEIEQKARTWWGEKDVFRSEPGKKSPGPDEKFFGNFPFPYMNGFLHLGHAFSLSKLEFAAAYHRLRGANVLLPFAFHCTGMPIKASADKLRREIQQFGDPPIFTKEVEEQVETQTETDEAPGNVPIDKFKGKKSKAASKSGGQMYQWEIMRSFGLSDTEISKFQDPYEWLRFFPPLAMEDLKAFGLGCDWRRSFVTTDINPYFDSFVQWQMRKLKSMGKIVKDVRYTIFSPLDGQPCADHDRASGEGVQPQEYTIIKMEVLPPFPAKIGPLEGKNVFLAAATLRPETMYGQTNAWVLPDGKYGAFEINETDVFILTERAALNLAYQNFSRFPQKPSCLVELTGYDLIGLRLKSPLSFNEVIYALPMLTILTDKGTGIVTSVPSDAPDDYMALHDLKAKPALRAKYGVIDEWVMPFEIVPIINIPEFGDKAAEKVCMDLKIKSQNEKEKLAEAKRLTYLRGFTEGTMLVGELAGRKVQEAKPLIRAKLIETGEAIIYSEPEKRVVSRSGDECVVALTDQWYITYGEEEWRKLAEECLSSMNLYSDETRHGFEHTLSWLNQWACSRSFGLGTRIPWDKDFLVESLSDSTIYMAYYTVAHLLHNDDMYGTNKPHPIQPAQMTDEVWDFIICGGSYPKSSDISSSVLEKMKHEFEYWYPFDLRVSGKDLIQNHLTFCMYNHTAIMAKHHWPRGFRCNGHIMLNSEKMSKSTGNFRTLRQAIEEFSADATRFSLADAGDGVDDANFVFETANAAILRLTKELSWMEEEILAVESSLRMGPPSTYADRVFENEMNIAVKMTEQSYRGYMFREALKTGFYDLQAARDEYRFSCGTGNMNRDLLWRFVDVQTRLIAPICPHYAEYVWRELLRKDGFVVNAGWPTAGSPDLTLKAANKYLQDSIVNMRKLLQKQHSGSKKANKKGAPVATLTEGKMIGLIYVNERFDGWKAECLRILQSKFDSNSRTFAPDTEIMEALKSSTVGQATDFKQTQKLCMPFLRFKKDEAIAMGPQALDLKLPFGEFDVLQENVDLIKRQLGLEEVEIFYATNADAVARAGSQVSVLNQNLPSPGKPSAIYLTR
ncbi:leucine--tRNA ligase, cytoplasmic isoform X2 [Ricinus communis]|uniref:leucine--tRNA ligase n=1 Tax=Ricinus communis TaxID=3988 RepID=B9SKB0_RICCO|nr:leucine--tRNA ligase, cytoplasmic isoform X1 [Ricinus communis]XP_015579207.1 leucine--tRNA ligase, cytoplasmic isoform X2 [Ricinus communis]EEF35924.1 leucyl-tRNA synthetase, putative [Ricinus communis]|eukprot:XP_002526429.1 leucine--tRNA ligase, cytoplasmic isoform X1 [Ricinus communis]